MVNRKTPLLALCLLFIGFASCKKSTVTPHSGPGKDLVLSAFEQQKVTSDNAFTLSLFKNLDSANTSGVNLFASPLSVSFALGMTSNGANGATLDAFKKVLNFNTLTTAQINTYYQTLLTNLPELDPNTTVKIANSIWYRQGFNVAPQFLQTNSTYFNAKVQALNFNDASSVTTITSMDRISGDRLLTALRLYRCSSAVACTRRGEKTDKHCSWLYSALCGLTVNSFASCNAKESGPSDGLEYCSTVKDDVG